MGTGIIMSTRARLSALFFVLAIAGGTSGTFGGSIYITAGFSSSQADFAYQSDPGIFKEAHVTASNSGLSNPAELITFANVQGIAPEQSLSSQAGVVFTSAYYLTSLATGIFGTNTPYITNFSTLSPPAVQNTMEIFFPQPYNADPGVSQFSFELKSQPGAETYVDVYKYAPGGGVWSSEVELNSDLGSNDFYTFTGVDANYITIKTRSSDNAFALTNLAFGAAPLSPADPTAAPLPSTAYAGLGLLGGLGVLTLARRRTRAARA